MINVRQGHEVKLDIYGVGLHNDAEVKLTSSMASPGHACKSQGLHVQVIKDIIFTAPGASVIKITYVNYKLF